MAYSEGIDVNIKASCEVEMASEIIKQLKECIESAEVLHLNINDLKNKLSPVTKLAETTPNKDPECRSQGNTKVAEVIDTLNDRIVGANYRIQQLFNLLEV